VAVENVIAQEIYVSFIKLMIIYSLACHSKSLWNTQKDTFWYHYGNILEECW